MSGRMSVSEVLESALYVVDLPAAEKFYTEILGLTLFSKQEGRHAFFRCGRRMMLLFKAEATAVSANGPKDAPTHGAKGEGHLAFAVRDREIDRWKQHLVQKGVEIEKEIHSNRGRSIYFRDPSQNSLESLRLEYGGFPNRRFAPSARGECAARRPALELRADCQPVLYCEGRMKVGRYVAAQGALSPAVQGTSPPSTNARPAPHGSPPQRHPHHKDRT